MVVLCWGETEDSRPEEEEMVARFRRLSRWDKKSHEQNQILLPKKLPALRLWRAEVYRNPYINKSALKRPVTDTPAQRLLNSECNHYTAILYLFLGMKDWP